MFKCDVTCKGYAFANYLHVDSGSLAVSTLNGAVMPDGPVTTKTMSLTATIVNHSSGNMSSGLATIEGLEEVELSCV